MLEKKYQTENSFIYEELDKEFLWIEKVFEEKLWELYDRIKKSNYHNSNFAKLLRDDSFHTCLINIK